MLRKVFVSLASVAALGLAGCEDRSGPVDIYVIHYDPAAGDFRLGPKTVSTIESVAEARGSVTRLLKEPVATADGQELILKDGSPPSILYSDRDGVVVPQDWDSLLLLSYYHHLEQSAAWFETVGFDSPVLLPVPSYYRMEIGLDPTAAGLVDNAAYAPTAHAFLLFESFFLADIPLAANDGVVTHEFGHAVFHRILNGEERFPIEDREQWPARAVNHMGGLHEGQADIYAAMQFDQPDFLGFSVPGHDGRDMSVERILTAKQASGQAGVHELGAVIAAAVWDVSDTVGRERAAELTLAASYALAPELGPDFHFAAFLQQFADAGTPEEHAASCSTFCVRFPGVTTRFPTCACP